MADINSTLTDIHPLAHLGPEIIFIHESSIPEVLDGDGFETSCVVVDVERKLINHIARLQACLAQAPYEYIVEIPEKDSAYTKLTEAFDAQQIFEQIVQPLTEATNR